MAVMGLAKQEKSTAGGQFLFRQEVCEVVRETEPYD